MAVLWACLYPLFVTKMSKQLSVRIVPEGSGRCDHGTGLAYLRSLTRPIFVNISVLTIIIDEDKH
jgi:hypothetical protein